MMFAAMAVRESEDVIMGYDIGICKVRRGFDFNGPEDENDIWIGRGRELCDLRDELIRYAYHPVEGYDPKDKDAEFEVPLDAKKLRDLVWLRRQLMDCEDFNVWMQLVDVCDDDFIETWFEGIGIDRLAQIHVAFRRVDDSHGVSVALHDLCFDYAYGLYACMGFLDSIFEKLDPKSVDDGVVWLWISY